ncbi:stalk domain-containing protein [Sporanaerobacter acetigenes]|uniref:Copper amine oxidase N-terminal domain-containing protein n=1 Tax=Sporanaerobacter acetigenes DSM 13106 TaxID=1123281 RepID=A0A1M5VFR1_9FIRM|nr:stalk domain-containing protein [Sporanaerobacter acetigenes]SHH74087.1 Copper amine oxidase N-terminal domain-containing protein [Sporanaerobacter acetigenes DSM 13106]
MFKNGRFKKVLVITMLAILVLSTVALAADNIYVKKLTATHGRIKFKVDGKDVTSEIENKYGSPAFVVHEYGSRAYVPVRAIADLMGLEVKYDDSTHTAEIIDTKSEQYEAEIEKKDKEIEELKKEIEKLKKNVVEETDLKAVEKKLNNNYGTYKDVDFDITLKESTNRIDVDIRMDLRDGRQESAWNKMGYNNKKDMIEDITDIISKEFTNVDIYGSIYDEFYKKDAMTFSKKRDSKVNISYDGRTADRYGYDEYDKYIDGIVYDEFKEKGIRDARLSRLDVDNRRISFEIDLYSDSETQFNELTSAQIAGILDRVSDKMIRYYDYDYRDRYYDDYYIVGHIYIGNYDKGEYYRVNSRAEGTFTKTAR